MGRKQIPPATGIRIGSALPILKSMMPKDKPLLNKLWGLRFLEDGVDVMIKSLWGFLLVNSMGKGAYHTVYLKINPLTL